MFARAVLSRILIAMVLAAGAAAAPALQVDGLYEASVPVPDRSDAARRQAARDALAQVLVKLTGDRTLATAAQTAALRAAAERYAQTFVYELRPVLPGAIEAGQQLNARLQFDAAAITLALRGLGYPLWGRDRPATLLWLAVTGVDGMTRVVGVDEAEQIVALLHAESLRRGTPIVLPLLDLDEQQSIDPRVLGGGLAQVVLQASERYGADAIMVATVTEAAFGNWEGQWQMQVAGDPVTWTGRAGSLEQLVHDGVDVMADQLAAHYVSAEQQRSEEQLRIVVNEVTAVDDYARVLKYLSALDAVTALTVTAVEPGRVQFAVRVRGGFAALDQIVALGDVIRSVPQRRGEYAMVLR